MPRSIAHFWCLEDVAADHSATLDRGFYTLLFLVKAIARRRLTGIHLAVISTGVHDVTGEEIVSPSKAAILGALSSISQEYPGFSVCNLDWSRQQSTDAVAGLISAFRSNQVSGVFCRRGGYYWKPVWEPLMTAPAASLIREGGVYLLVGGLGSIGLILSEFFAETAPGETGAGGPLSLPGPSRLGKLILPGAASLRNCNTRFAGCRRSKRSALQSSPSQRMFVMLQPWNMPLPGGRPLWTCRRRVPSGRSVPPSAVPYP